MKDKHYLYRVAVTCYVDSLFYETIIHKTNGSA